MSAPDGTGHFVLGLIVALIWALLGYGLVLLGLHPIATAAWIGWAVQTEHWISREQRDYQIITGLDAHDVKDVITSYFEVLAA